MTMSEGLLMSIDGREKGHYALLKIWILLFKLDMRSAMNIMMINGSVQHLHLLYFPREG